MIKKLATLAIGLAAMFLLLEGLVRLLKPNGSETLPAFTADEHTGWSRPPNQHGYIIQRVPGIFKTQFQTNSRGMRDREYALAKNGKPRILVLGDSVTEGWGVEEKETYPKVLEADYLRDVEVWNLGVVGYSTDQELQQLRQVVDATKPDIVVLAFFFNDLVENSLNQARWPPFYVKPHFAEQNGEWALTNAQALVEQKSQAASLRSRTRRALEESALFRLTRYALKTARDSMASKRRPQPGHGGPSPEWYAIDNLYRIKQPEGLNTAWKLAEGLLMEVQRLCASHGATFVLIYVPDPWDGTSNMLPKTLQLMGVNDPPSVFDTNMIEARLADLAKRNGIRFIPLTQRFRAAPDPARLFLPQLPKDPHIGPEGHRLVAGALGQYLQQEGLLPAQDFRAGSSH